MAAGRQNFSRKSYSNRSDEETGSYKNRFDQRVFSRRVDRPSDKLAKSDHRRNGFIDSDHDLQAKNMKVDYSEIGANSGSTKKRKFSPIVWDRVEKQVRISSVRSDNTRPSSPKSFKDFGRIERCSVSVERELQVSSVESVVSNVSDDVEIPSSLATRSPEERYQEIENEDGEYFEQPNLYKSKWAFKDLPVYESDVNNSSPESGEFKRDDSERNDEVSSLSTEDGCFSAPSSGDPKKVDDKVAGDSASMGYSSSESDSDHEDMLSTGIGMIPSCRNVFEFERLGKISEGTYGVVHKARDLKTGDLVALKKVKTGKERDGFPVTALREINILGMLQHPSLVQMKEVVMDDFNGVYMVMEYVDNELKGYMERMKQPFSQSEVKCLMLQLLEGVAYLHDNYVMHRDLKTSNLLLNNNGELKVCDFGMARQYASPLKPYTSLVVTLWYRAPELLLGMKSYSTAVDMWSVGCIMAELLSKKPLFDGSKELEQIDKIFRTLGTPNDSIWPGYSKLPGVKSNFVKQPYNTLRKKFPVATFTGSPVLTELGFDLLNKFLTYDPEKRITAKEALNHGWFCEAPLPAEHVRICR
ncbi:hypothetical protein L1987_47454 [Smallanthus sonchifolius]|uniref:Uncharacterized protein n=1 Tax=Smallanthus sonchifolius TaxID=185202 RepID=A0ACB9G2H4_9ASTR|nr:hypothetical protein L1987_47454 [Smallanthus sonchifolius]